RSQHALLVSTMWEERGSKGASLTTRTLRNDMFLDLLAENLKHERFNRCRRQRRGFDAFLFRQPGDQIFDRIVAAGKWRCIAAIELLLRRQDNGVTSSFETKRLQPQRVTHQARNLRTEREQLADRIFSQR